MIEPSKVSAAAQKRENENVKFRTFLKCNADSDELDRQFLELHNELFAGYDCCKCNNCCREYNTVVLEDEIDSISAFLGLTKQELIVHVPGLKPPAFSRLAFSSFPRDLISRNFSRLSGGNPTYRLSAGSR